jgi:hypothetical protein
MKVVCNQLFIRKGDRTCKFARADNYPRCPHSTTPQDRSSPQFGACTGHTHTGAHYIDATPEVITALKLLGGTK